MKSDVKQLLQLQEKERTTERLAQHTEGELSQVLKRLKTEFGCASLEEAKALLKKKQTLVDKEMTSLQKDKDEFDKQWNAKLDEYE
jgi:hypothetical protein